VLVGALLLWLGRAAPQPALPDAERALEATSIDAPESLTTAASDPLRESSERTPLATAPVSDEETEIAYLEIVIAAADGTRIDGAKVASFRNGELLDSGSSGATGRVHFRSNPGPGEIALLAPGRALLRESLDLGAGVHTISLADGESIQGWIEVDGAPPRVPIALVWTSVGSSRDLFNSLPAAVREALSGTFADGLPRTTTDIRGAFAFRGLNSGSFGTLEWEGPYWNNERLPGVEVRAARFSVPQRDLRLSFSEGVELRLRVVDTEGAPVPRARVIVETMLQAEGDAQEGIWTVFADDQGRAKFALPHAPLARVNACVSLPDGGGELRHELGVPDRERGAWEVGDLGIGGTRALLVSVRDTDAAPVDGASIWAEPSESLGAPQAGKGAGHYRLSLSPADTHVCVRAKGHLWARVALAPDQQQLEVVLERLCRIEIVPVGYQGQAGELRVELLAAAPILAPQARSGWRRDESSVWMSADARGRWISAELNPDLALRARLHYHGARVLAEAMIEPLARGEHRRVELLVEAQPLELRVFVRDAAGAPLRAAQVQRRHSNFSWLAAETLDAHGSLRIPAIYAQPFSLLAQAPGFATTVVHGVTVPPHECTLVLQPPRTLEVELRNPDGTRYANQSTLSAHYGGATPVLGTSLGEGRWRLDGLPSGEIDLFCSGAFGQLQALHDTAIATRTLVVGEPGSLRVNVFVAGGDRSLEWSLVLSEGGAGLARRRMRFILDREGRAQVSLQGLALGAHDVWLEARGGSAGGAWTRSGTIVRVRLDSEHPGGEIELLP